MVALHTIPSGASARLVRIGGERGFQRRLMELGFLPGTAVRVVRHVEVGRLIELEVRGCHVSLRPSEAGQVLVEPVA